MDNYTWSKPMTLKYPVKDGATTVLPAGTPNVEIGFHQSSKILRDKVTGKTSRQNVYRHNGQIYNA